MVKLIKKTSATRDFPIRAYWREEGWPAGGDWADTPSMSQHCYKIGPRGQKIPCLCKTFDCEVDSWDLWDDCNVGDQVMRRTC